MADLEKAAQAEPTVAALHLDAFAAGRRQAFTNKMLAVPRLTDFCLLVHREVLERIGRLDERNGLF